MALNALSALVVNENSMTTSKKTRWVMAIDLRRCTGCHTCSVACKNENQVPLSVFRSWVKQIEKGRYPKVRRSFLPLLCNNCKKPICVTVCPVNASITRPDGIVYIDPHLCIGCRYCMASCPYAARHINPLKHICEKCFFCYHRVDRGLVPACVEACPTGARFFGDINDPNSAVSKLIAMEPVATIKPEFGTQPQVFYIALDLAAVETRERMIIGE